MSASKPTQNPPPDDVEELLDADDAAEEIAQDEDHPMQGEDEDEDEDENEDEDEEDDMQEEIHFQNDSAAHFDSHTDSIFCIAQHPLNPSLIVTGGGDDIAYLFDTSLEDTEAGPLLPQSYESDPQPKGARKSIPPLQKLDGHTDSVNAVAFTQPSGEYLLTAGLDGKLRAWSSSSSSSTSPSTTTTYTFLSESSEVPEINWLSPCPSLSHPNTLALGASDGSVWVYTLNSTDTTTPLSITQAYYLHTQSCTAGSWTPDGKLLATVSEDSSFHVYDVWGEAAGLTSGSRSQALISLTSSDQRFHVEGGLYSIAISPNGTLAALGGASGHIRVISLPRLTTTGPNSTQSGTGPHSKPPPSPSSTGTLLATLHSQSDSIESLTFSPPPPHLLAASSVDGSIALFDVNHRFALRRLIANAHAGDAVVQIDFVPGPDNHRHYLTSAGMDGVLRRWDTRGAGSSAGSGGTAAAPPPSSGTGASQQQQQQQQQGLVREWRGHRGDGDGAGILAFVQGGDGGGTIVTAGDDGVALVFRAEG